MSIYHQKKGTASNTKHQAATGQSGDDSGDDARRTLTLEAKVESLARGWRVRLPVRAEHIRIDKRTIVAEEVIVRTAPVQDTVQFNETVRREELRVEADEDAYVDVTQPFDGAPRRDGPARYDTPGQPPYR